MASKLFACPPMGSKVEGRPEPGEGWVIRRDNIDSTFMYVVDQQRSRNRLTKSRILSVVPYERLLGLRDKGLGCLV
jgi:hypothetical protein